MIARERVLWCRMAETEPLGLGFCLGTNHKRLTTATPPPPPFTAFVTIHLSALVVRG
jgi:hypothetical protein